MRPNTSITLPLMMPGHSASLSATHLTYSDYRRFINPSCTNVHGLLRVLSPRRLYHPPRQARILPH